LDRFEITVGRFRAFVRAYPGSKPKPGAGEHPLIDGSGWDAAWDERLPPDQTALMGVLKCGPSFQTWTDAEGPNEDLPMNCIDWYEAFAFCAWDGARLPTESEWNYAAAGGSEQRIYPWSTPANDATIDGSYAAYDCTADGSAPQECVFADILRVGLRSPKGDGRWGQADLAGSMWEWNLDWYADQYLESCSDCARTQATVNRVIRGGGWNGSFGLDSVFRYPNDPLNRNFNLGVRCARTP
jgi:formylglycine-generating enzyme required for sulfatase activity